MRSHTEGKGKASGESSDAYLSTKTRTHDEGKGYKKLVYYKLLGGACQEKTDSPSVLVRLDIPSFHEGVM